jgi:hypothetical protein
VSIGRGLSPPEAGAGRSSRRARGDGERPREGEEEPLERLVLVLELVPLELEEPPLREELPLLDEDREAGMALGSYSGRPATKQIVCQRCLMPGISGHRSERSNRRMASPSERSASQMQAR